MEEWSSTRNFNEQTNFNEPLPLIIEGESTTLNGKSNGKVNGKEKG